MNDFTTVLDVNKEKRRVKFIAKIGDITLQSSAKISFKLHFNRNNCASEIPFIESVDDFHGKCKDPMMIDFKDRVNEVLKNWD
jgi:hypothetical protein